MLGNAFCKVKNLVDSEAYALSYYLHQLCLEIRDMESHEECQVLYNALIEKLNLGKHAEAVLNSIVNKLEKKGKLNRKNVSEIRKDINIHLI